MKAKKLLAAILAVAMILGTMSLPAFAAEGEAESEWGSNTVRVGDVYYPTLTAALNAVYTSTPTETVTVECKPGAEVGQMSHVHVADDIIINGNGARVTPGGDQDIEIDTFKYSRSDAKQQDKVNGTYLDEEITVTVNQLNGIAAWGQRNTDYTINLTFNNCNDMNRIYFSGKTGTNNITLNNCTFSQNTASNCTVYSNAAGTITLDGCTFTGVNEPVNINTKTENAVVIINVNNCTFTDCGQGTGGDKSWAAPIRVLTSAATAKSTLNVDASTTFKYSEGVSPANGDILIGEGRSGEVVYDNVTANISADAEVQYQEPGYYADKDGTLSVARIGNMGYATISAAIAAANDGDTITILAGTYNAFTVPADKNNLTIQGETDAKGNNLVTVKTLEEDVDTHTRGIFVQAETTTIKNLNVTAGTVAGDRSSWMSSSLGNTNGDTGARSNLKNLTVEGCNFNGSGTRQAIWTNQGNITMKNCTVSNYNLGIDDYAIGADQKVVIEGTKFSNVHAPFHTGEALAGSKIEVTDSVIDSEIIDVGGAVNVAITGSTIKNATVTIYNKANMTITESELYDTNYAIASGGTGKITLDKNYANNVEELAGLSAAGTITFVPAASEAVYVQFEEVTADGAEGERLYDIKLAATEKTIINRLNSADLTFSLTPLEGKIGYQIITPGSEISINPVENCADRYEFHYNGKDNAADTAEKITIGRVKFEGYGRFDFAVDTEAATNVVHATKTADNLVDTFVPNGDTTTVANGELVIDGAKLENVEITVPTEQLIINVTFPNAVVDNAAAYQDMKVVISGGDLAAAKEYQLGTDGTAMTDGGVYTITTDLTKDRAYTVTVSGAGYRTARYTVTMTEDKTLNFWNNVKDNAVTIEEGKTTGAVTKNFLAGDIVKDNNINIYDLSAVVSYFGTEGLSATNHSEYAKYDLNRDGKIDSKDVAYVLVSWNQ